MSAPAVSVILPAFNRLRHLRAAIESIFLQTFTDWELIVADDGSDAETQAYLRSLASPRVQIVWLPHSGHPSIVRNAALARAQGRYVAFMDSDDLWLPSKLAVQWEYLRSHPRARWSYSAVQRIEESGRPADMRGVKPWKAYEGFIVEPLLNIDALIATPSVMAERSLITEAGGFDSQQRYGEDYDLWLRLALRSEALAIAAPLACVRVHADNFSRDRTGAHAGWVRLYGKMYRLMPNARLRSVCRVRRMQSALTLANSLLLCNRDGVTKVILQSAGYSWRYLRWWTGVLKLSMRMLLRRVGSAPRRPRSNPL